MCEMRASVVCHAGGWKCRGGFPPTQPGCSAGRAATRGTATTRRTAAAG